MREQLQALESVALEAVSKAADLEELNNLRVRFLGKKGELTAICVGWPRCRRRNAP